MKNMKFSIRSVVLTLLISSIILVSVGIVYTVSDKFNTKLMGYMVNDIEHIAQNCKDEVVDSIFRIQTANELMEVNEEFIDSLAIQSPDNLDNLIAISNIKSHLTAVRDSVSKGANGYSITFFIDSNQPLSGLLEDYSNKNIIPDSVYLYSDIGLDENEWYKSLTKSTGNFYIFEDEKVPHYVFVAQRLENGLDPEGKSLGIILAAINFESVLRRYAGVENTEYLQMLILNSHGEVICTNSETIDQSVRTFVSSGKDTIDTYSDQMTDVTISGKDYYTSLQSLDFGMMLVTLVPKDEIFITVKETTSGVYGVVLIILIAVLVVAIYLAGIIVRPIKKLSDFMKSRDADKTPHFSAEDSRILEIDTLNRAYDTMLKRNQNLLETAQTLGAQKMETEFKMLQAQINPHYLYNALDSISWMALKKGEEDIADMISALADSFRYNAKTSEMIIDFESELEFIENYVKLQEKSRGITIDLKVDVEEELKKQMVPKFVLQPLVENSIIHGMRRDSSEIKIRIFAWQDGDVLQIHTEDNGAGFDADALNRHLDGDKTVFDTEKIGIINIHKRVKNKYGEKAGLWYSTNEHGGLTATVTLRLKGEKDSEIF